MMVCRIAPLDSVTSAIDLVISLMNILYSLDNFHPRSNVTIWTNTAVVIMSAQHVASLVLLWYLLLQLIQLS